MSDQLTVTVYLQRKIQRHAWMHTAGFELVQVRAGYRRATRQPYCAAAAV
jgi:hypothetical protein